VITGPALLRDEMHLPYSVSPSRVSRGGIDRRCLGLGLVGLLGACATQAPQGAIVVTTHSYATGRLEDGETALLLDLYRPDRTIPRATLVLMHGGGFIGGSRDLAENVEIARFLAERGFAVASISYRFAQQRPIIRPNFEAYAAFVETLPLPLAVQMRANFGDAWSRAVAAGVEDALAALAWVGRVGSASGHAPTGIGMIGMSAGAVTATSIGYLARKFGLPPAGLDAIVCIRGAILDHSVDFVSDDPDLLIAHGAEDNVVALAEAEHLIAAARRAELDSELHVFPGFGHDLGGQPLLDAPTDQGGVFADRLLAFLERVFR
jgi:predicted esterase